MLSMQNLRDTGVAPWIVVSFGDTTADEVLLAKQQGMDVAECRVDLLSDVSVVSVKKHLELFQGVPILLTIRTQQEGGQWSGSESERLDLFTALLPLVDIVDIELSSGIREEVSVLAKNLGKEVLFSQHDFTKTPDTDTLNRLLSEATGLGGDVFKVATQINSQADLHVLVQFLQDHQDNNIVVIGMGQKGMVSRIFFPALGSLLTFTYTGEPTAPGQLDLPTTTKMVKQFYT